MHSTAKSNAANPCQRGKSFGWFLIEILFITPSIELLKPLPVAAVRRRLNGPVWRYIVDHSRSATLLG
jgi:hypothetical protein